MEFLATFIISLGVSYVMSKVMDKQSQDTYEKLRNNESIKESSLRKLLNDIISAVSKQGNKAVDAWNRKLEQFVILNPTASSVLKTYRIKAKNKAVKRADEAKQKLDDKLSDLNAVEKNLSDYSYTPDSYKTSLAGQLEREDLARDVLSKAKDYQNNTGDQSYNSQINNLEQAVKDSEEKTFMPKVSKNGGSGRW